MAAKKRGLGSGLDNLIPDIGLETTEVKREKSENENVSRETLIPIIKIEPNRAQPRTRFDEDALQELADSIKQYGIIEPIVVQKRDNFYEIIAGERRWRAARMAGLNEVPVVIKEYSEDEIFTIALIENIQREDLNPIDEATSINNIIKLRGYTQEEFANKFGKSRTYVTNILGLLKLPEDVKKMVEKKNISMSHARVLSKMDDDEKVVQLAKQVISEEISVRDLERITSEPTVTKKKKINVETNYRLYENIVCDKLGSKVRISKNKMEIYFENKKDLERILETLNISIEDE